MGLDMFLTSSNYWDEKKEIVKEDWTQYAYWRKINWLHRFFCTYGEECEDGFTYLIPRSTIFYLLSVITKVLNARDKYKAAIKYLPTRSGCFFGPIEYNENYFESLLKVLADLANVLNTYSDNSFLYIASW